MKMKTTFRQLEMVGTKVFIDELLLGRIAITKFDDAVKILFKLKETCVEISETCNNQLS